MLTHEQSRKEKIEVLYILSGISADVDQMARAHIRGDAKRVNRDISQIIAKLENIRKRF